MAQAQKTGTHWRHVHRRMNEHLLFAEDLGPVGTKVDLEVIDSGQIAVKGAGKRTKPMPWLAFAGRDGKPKTKRLGLNVTNCKTMEAITGTPVIEQWRGWITLVVVATEYTDSETGERCKTHAIRIAPTRPRTGRAPASASEQAAAAQRGEPVTTQQEELAAADAPPIDADEAAEIARREREGNA